MFSRYGNPFNKLIKVLSLSAMAFANPIFGQMTDLQYLNDFAQFTIGKPTNNSELTSISTKSWYLDHVNTAKKARKSVFQRKLAPIGAWLEKEQLIAQTDTQTLFYPFSGPDFLYGNLFYPHCNNMIMVGLEKVGEIPDFISLTEQEQKAYLFALRNSLRYINNAGYFITKHMKSDFKIKNFDGISHVLLYYLASAGNELVSYSKVYINEYGLVTKGLPYSSYYAARGVKIAYRAIPGGKIRTLYYFKYDLSDKNFMYKPEFYTFLTSFGTKSTYIKSGSYLLMHNSFSVLRNHILRQSSKILQDDSGIPYKFFDKTDFGVNLYGTYTKTTKDFPYAFQADLKQMMLRSPGHGDLGFTLGYNTWNKETVLMHAIKGIPAKVKEGIVPRYKDKPEFKVQVLVTENWQDTTSPVFYGLKNVAVYYEDGLFKYTIGNESTPEECNKHKIAALKAGFKQAFTVAFLNEKRIAMQLARANLIFDNY